MCLRGGRLRRPIVPQKVQEVDGLTFLRIGKQDPDVCDFLSGRNWRLHPLKATTILEELCSLRNDKVHDMCKNGKQALSLLSRVQYCTEQCCTVLNTNVLCLRGCSVDSPCF